MKQSTYLRRVLNALHTHGYVIVDVDDGGDEMVKVQDSIQKTMDAVRAVDCAWIHVRNDQHDGSMFVVWQGPDIETDVPEEVLADYGMNLEPIIEGVPTE